MARSQTKVRKAKPLVTITARVEENLYDAISSMAYSDGMSLSATMDILLAEAVAARGVDIDKMKSNGNERKPTI